MRTRKMVAVLMIACVLLIGCKSTQTHHYTWEISVIPKEGDQYEFNAKLTNTQLESNGTSANTMLTPTLTLTPNKPAEMRVGVNGQPPDLQANVLLNEKKNKVIVTYSVLIKEDNVTHKTKGKIEIDK